MRDAGLPRCLLSAALACLARTSSAPAQPLGPEFRVNSYTTSSQRNARIATDPGGNFVVVWQSSLQVGSTDGIFAQRYASTGAPLGAEFRVNTHTTYGQRYPSIAGDAAGNFVVAWQVSDDGFGTGEGVLGRRYTSAGAPLGAEFLVNTYTTNYQSRPAIASDAAGNFVVVWRSAGQDGSGDGVFGQRYDSAGAPLGVEFRVNTVTLFFQNYPSVASDASGNFVVVWQSGPFQDGSSYGVFGQRYDSAGAPLGGEFPVNTYTSSSQGFPSVALAPGGGFVVVWRSAVAGNAGQDGSYDTVIGQRYGSTGAPLGTEFLINTYTTNAQTFPSVASDSAGNFVVVWESYGQGELLTDASVFGQRFSSAGNPLGDEFRVNTYTPLSQSHPFVASDPEGKFVVTWNSIGQDGAFYGVFGQRFCSALFSVTISVNGSTTVCTTTTSGTVTVSDLSGGIRTHQWGYRAMPGSVFTSPISGQTGATYLIDGSDFLAGPGTYYLVCATFPECGPVTFSNEITVVVTADPTAPSVTPPTGLTTTQTLCL